MRSRRDRVSLTDLDAWVADPAKYERERETFVETVVRKGLALFGDESEAALRPNEGGPRVAGDRADVYQIYMRELRNIPPMERSEEFRYVLALEICKEALRREMLVPAPSAAEIGEMESAVNSHDPTFSRLLQEARAKTNKKQSGDAARSAARTERVKQRFDEMLAWKRVLVFRTLPLVPGMARKYRGMGVPVMDLIQEANGSLMKATDRYEWRRGVRFVVYARWWVQQGVLKTLSCQSRTVRTPVYMAQKLKKIRDLNARAFTEAGDHLSAAEIGKALDEPVARVERALAAAKMTISIDRELDPTGEFMLKDVLEDPRKTEIDDRPAGPSLGNRIENLLSSLPQRERLVLELRYGLGERKAETLEQVSTRLGVSRERVRQIQEQALRRLQAPSKRLKLAEYIESES